MEGPREETSPVSQPGTSQAGEKSEPSTDPSAHAQATLADEPATKTGDAKVSVSESGEPETSHEESHWLMLWWQELTSLAFSFACFAVNACILWELDNKELQSWRIANVNITPNALISIVATLSKASMLLPVAECISQMKWREYSSPQCNGAGVDIILVYFERKTHRLYDIQIFDDASRGPLGSVKLLWSLLIHVGVVAGCEIPVLTNCRQFWRLWEQRSPFWLLQLSPSSNRSSLTAI